MTAFTFIIYYASWVAVIYFAGKKAAAAAALVSFLAIAVQIFLWSFIDRKQCIKEIFLALYALLIGILFETLYLNLGITAFPTKGLFFFLPPLWIVLLYPLLSLTLYGPFAWMVKKLSLSIIFGMLAPLCYIGGEKVQALSLPLGTIMAFLVIGPAWAFVLTLLSKLADIVGIYADLAFNKQSHLNILFDGECPICSREISFLKKKESPLGYIDISEKEFKARGFASISYEEAMRGMIAIDSKNIVYKGIEAFKEIYSRRGWPFIAVMLSLPGFKQFFQAAYKVFASLRPHLKNRNLFPQNIDQQGRVLRFIFAILFLGGALWWKSWIFLLISLFIFFEVLMSWCIVYQFLGKKSCEIKKK